MPFDGQATNESITSGLSAVLLLNASCQAVIEAEIHQVSSPWYTQLDQELGRAENLVVGWRRSGVLSFSSDVLGAISTAGAAFLDARQRVDALFTALAQHENAGTLAQLVNALEALQPPVRGVADRIGGYLGQLGQFESQMSTAQQAMQATIGQVQAEEQQIQSQITGINAQISELDQQIKTDRDAIATARSERTGGIIETIFGILFAPFTAGASLILAGIGVASIADAEKDIDAMESNIAGYQKTIAGDQTGLTQDQAIVATLGALTLSTSYVLTDMGQIQTALDALRTHWTELDGELAGVITKVADAAAAPDVVVAQAWYDAACTEWGLVTAYVAGIGTPQIATRRVPVG